MKIAESAVATPTRRWQPVHIFLASRVLVMTARPGRIKTDVRNDLPHPRRYTIKTSPEFSALKARLTEEIRAEVVLADTADRMS